MYKRPVTVVTRLTRPNYAPAPSSNKWPLGLSVFIGSSLIMKHTLFSGWYRYWLERKSGKDGKNVLASKNVLALVERAMEDLQFPLSEREMVKVIVGTSPCSFSVGSTDTVFGAYLAVPQHFNSSDHKVIDEENIQFMMKNSLTKDELSKLQDTFNLSEDAKLYTIARQLIKCRSSVSYVSQGFIASVVSCATIFGYKFLSDAYFAFRPLFFRIPLCGLCCLLGFLIFKAPSYLLYAYEDEIAEKQVCCLGENYVSGGIEVCQKALQREDLLERFSPLAFWSYEDSSPLSVMPFSERLALLQEKKR